MKKVFVPSTKSITELTTTIKMIENLGLAKEQTFIGGSFDKFVDKLTDGDTALVFSLTMFNSITEILAQMNAMQEHGVKLESISEPWFNNPKTTSKELLTELFKLGNKIHAPMNTVEVTKTKKKGPGSRILPLVEHAERLRIDLNVPVNKACQIAGCSIRAYYTYRKKL
ncbi:MAG: hypothetical protein RR465_04495 [Mucinivorans sp.]